MRLKWLDFDNSFSSRSKYYEAMGLGSASSYTGTAKQNNAMIELMKKNGYKIGSKSTDDELNWIHPNEILYRASDGGMLHTFGNGDKVFTEDMANNLWNIAQMNLASNIPKYDFAPVTKQGQSQNISIDIGDVQVVANNPQEFTQQMKAVIKSDSSVRKLLNDVTFGDSLGRNTLTRFTR